MEPTPALESAPYLEYVELIVSFPYFESNLPLLQSTHIKIHIQEQTVMSNNNIFKKNLSPKVVTNPTMEPAPAMEPIPAVPSQLSRYLNRGLKKAWNHTLNPIPEPESQHP